MPIYPYSFQLPPLNVQDIPNDGAPGEFLGINVGGALDWLPAGGGGSGDMLAANNLSELTNFATARTNIGLGTASTPTFANLTLTSPSLASSAPVTISQTWNNAAVAFTGLKVDATNTNSAAASKLLDLQVGGVSQTSFNKVGGLRFNTSGQFAAGLGMGWASTGFYSIGGNQMFVVENGTARFEFGAQRFCLDPTTVLGWGTIGLTPDTILLRDGAANTLALRNGTTAQTFRVYKSYLNAGVDYERLSFSHDGVQFGIGTERAGSGIAQPLRFFGGSSAALDFASGVSFRNASGGTTFMTVASSGNVGIGTTAPGAKLEVVGNILVNGATQIIDDGNILSVKGSTTNAFKAGYIVVTSGDNLVTTYQGSVTSGGFFGTFTNHKCFIRTSNVERVTIDTVGNVGIGTTAPGAKLEVVGGSSDILVLKNAAQSVFSVTSNGGGGTIAFNHANSPNLVINQSTGNKITLGVGSNNLHASNLSNVPIDLIIQGTGGNVGIGTTSPTSKLHVAETWNAVGTTFTAVNVNVTDTASAATSKLLDLQVGGVSKFSVDKSGIIALPQTGGDAAALICGGSAVTNAATYIGIYGIRLDSTSSIQWSNGKNLTVLDTILLRDGEADHLAMRRSTNGQKFSVYGTYPGAAWERFTITAPTSGNVLLGTYIGTGGVARGMEFQTNGITRLTINSSGTSFFAGSARFDSFFYIGASNGISLQSGGTSDGILLLQNSATNNFNRIQLGGSTDSFPALKRSTTRVQAVLATTETTFTNIQGKLTTDTDYTAGSISPTGFLTLYDAQGNAYKVPCVAA